MPAEPIEPPAPLGPGVFTIAAEELLMRGVLNQPKQYDRRRSFPLQEGAFLPRKTDNTGLSVSRRQSDAHPDFLTPQELKSRCRAHRPETSGVVQLTTEQITGIGLRVEPDPTPADPETGSAANPGHAILPDITFERFSNDETREQVRLWAAELAGLAEVVIVPG